MLNVGDRVFWNHNKRRERNLRDFRGVVFNVVRLENDEIDYKIRFDNGMDYSYKEFDECGKRTIYKIDSINPNSKIVIKF